MVPQAAGVPAEGGGFFASLFGYGAAEGDEAVTTAAASVPAPESVGLEAAAAAPAEPSETGGPEAGGGAPPPAAEASAPPPPAPPAAAAPAPALALAAAPGVRNIFRELLARVGGGGFEEEYRQVFSGLARLLNNAWEANNTYLPGSVMEVECHQEVLVLLWKLLEENEGFMPYVLKHCDVSRQLVVPLCYLLFEARRDPARVGLVHICTFILLKLSGERNFCVQLNRPFDTVLPCTDFPLFSGSHADLLVLVLHKLVVNGTDKLAPLYNCFLTIICNTSPYTRTLCLLSSVKLLSLFELFTSPRFLYAAEGNHVYVSLLLETFNNMVQYQYAGNPHLVYGN